jgi:hypothetical protein
VKDKEWLGHPLHFGSQIMTSKVVKHLSQDGIGPTADGNCALANRFYVGIHRFQQFG